MRTQKELIKYIRTQLGEPVVKVEVLDEQIEQIILDVIQKFTEYAYGTLENVKILTFKGIGDYPMPTGMTNVIHLSKTSDKTPNFGKFVPDLWTEQQHQSMDTAFSAQYVQQSSIQRFFEQKLSFNYNTYKNILQLQENYFGNALLHYNYEYIPNPENDGIYNHEFIKEYAKAKTKFLWGTNVGKFSQSLLGGATINYSDIQTDAKEDMQRLEELLLSKYTDPAPIDVA